MCLHQSEIIFYRRENRFYRQKYKFLLVGNMFPLLGRTVFTDKNMCFTSAKFIFGTEKVFLQAKLCFQQWEMYFYYWEKLLLQAKRCVSASGKYISTIRRNSFYRPKYVFPLVEKMFPPLGKIVFKVKFMCVYKREICFQYLEKFFFCQKYVFLLV